MSAEYEIWLRPNRRALALGAAIGVLVTAAGWLPLLTGPPMNGFVRWGLALIGAVGAISAIAFLYSIQRPVVAYQDGRLLVTTGAGRPRQIPIDAVEVFFLGQGGTNVKPRGQKAEARNVVVRLAEREKQWHQQEMPRVLGKWQDGYISLNGTWCEPIDGDLLKRLNHQLVEIKRARRGGV